MEIQTINFEKFKYNFYESWHKSLKPFIESEECYNLLNELTKQSKLGKTILPSKKYLWRAFQETEFDKMHTVFLALSPYPQLNTGDGLCFSNSLTNNESPSLRIILDAVEDDLGYKDSRNKDLKRWANQGVLMLNSALTCELNSPKSHLDLWKPFIEYLYKNVFNDRNLIFVYFGKDAAEFQGLETKGLHKSIVVEHPSYAARQERGLIHKKLFTNVNKWLKEDGQMEIKWQEYGDLPFEKVETEEHFLM